MSIGEIEATPIDTTSSLFPDEDEDDDQDETALPSIANTSNSSISSFPHWTESFGDGGSRIAYELYRFWDEDSDVVSPQPFSYLLYGDGSHSWDSTSVHGCTCSYTAKTLGEALECCAASKEKDQELLSSMTMRGCLDSDCESELHYEWNPGPCQEWNHHVYTPTQTDIPFADGQLYGNATEFDTLLITDPASDSCWYFSCSLLLPEDRLTPEDRLATCVGLLHENLRLVSLEEFVGAIKDLTYD